eukprot:m.176701 g.176701  ORF g.176701 m.176701 type:complete len:336 (-) comp10433_c0_seq1:1144-2151(-)
MNSGEASLRAHRTVCCSLKSVQLKLAGQQRALFDGALCIELRRDIGAADTVNANRRLLFAALAVTLEFLLELAERNLTSANNHRVDLKHLILPLDLDVQPGIVHLFVAHALHHDDAALGQRAAVDPPCGLAETLAKLVILALEQVDGATRSLVVLLHAGNAATDLVLLVNAPLVQKLVNVRRGGGSTVCDLVSNVKTDAASADDGNALANGSVVSQDVHIGDHLGMVVPRKVDLARHDASRNDALLKTLADDGVSRGKSLEAKLDAGQLKALAKVADGLVELLLAGNALCHVELATNIIGSLKERHIVATGSSSGGTRQSSRAGTDDGHFLWLGC